MRPLLTRFAALAFTLTLAACHHAAPKPTEPTGGSGGSGEQPVSSEEPVAAGQVCCESFGYGAQMVKCCEEYAWTAADACTIPPGFVGGGKQVVANDKCPAQ